MHALWNMRFFGSVDLKLTFISQCIIYWSFSPMITKYTFRVVTNLVIAFTVMCLNHGQIYINASLLHKFHCHLLSNGSHVFGDTFIVVPSHSSSMVTSEEQVSKFTALLRLKLGFHMSEIFTLQIETRRICV